MVARKQPWTIVLLSEYTPRSRDRLRSVSSERERGGGKKSEGSKVVLEKGIITEAPGLVL